MSADKRLCILDCVALKGESRSVMALPLRERLAASRPLQRVIRSQVLGNCTEQVYYALADMRHAVQRLQVTNAATPIDGLVFTSLTLPYHSGRDRNLFKWKPLEKNTVDVLWRRETAPNVYVRGDNDDDDLLRPLGRLADGEVVDDIETATIILECLPCDASGQLWRISKLRRDRQEPNAAWVAKRVCESIREDLRLEELLEFDGVR